MLFGGSDVMVEPGAVRDCHRSYPNSLLLPAMSCLIESSPLHTYTVGLLEAFKVIAECAVDHIVINDQHSLIRIDVFPLRRFWSESVELRCSDRLDTRGNE